MSDLAVAISHVADNQGRRAANIGFITSFLWSNAGFNRLRKLKKDLDKYEPRYDPTVTPLAKEGDTAFGVKEVNEAIASFKHQGTPGQYHSAADFHTAFSSGRLSPLKVTETLLELISTHAEHAKAFLDINKPVILAAAEESSRRYKAGRPLGLLDGVPVGIKDEVDLEGHQKSLGSCKSEPCPEGGTSWCVKKLEEAGAIIMGKLNVGLLLERSNPHRSLCRDHKTCWNIVDVFSEATFGLVLPSLPAAIELY